jgi:3-oxoadipate enol-lactonase
MSATTYHLVTTDRLTMSIRRQGDADGLPMLLLHGGLATGRWWDPLLAVLPDAICAIAPDLRGCGASDRPDQGYSIEEQAADVLALLHALGWEEVDVVGHASGAAIAVEVALMQPQAARTLTLVAPAPIEGVFTPVDMLMVLEQMRHDRELLAQALAAVMPSIDREDAANAVFFAQLVADAAALAAPVFTEIALSLSRWNRFGHARRLTMPTCLIWGDQDIIVTRDAVTRTLIAIPGANNLEVLRGVGHAPMIEAPVRLAERLIDFITEDFDDFEEARRMAADGSAGTHSTMRD